MEISLNEGGYGRALRHLPSVLRHYRSTDRANYHYEIKSKLGVRSDIELVYLCMGQGLVPSLLSTGSVPV